MAAQLDSVPPPPSAGVQGSKPGSLPNILAVTLAYGPDTATTAQETLRAIASRCLAGRRRLLIDLRMVTDQSEGARLCYRHTLAHLVGPIAILVGPNVSRFLGEFLVRTLRGRHDIRTFLNEDNARKWLAEAE